MPLGVRSRARACGRHGSDTRRAAAGGLRDGPRYDRPAGRRSRRRHGPRDVSPQRTRRLARRERALRRVRGRLPGERARLRALARPRPRRAPGQPRPTSRVPARRGRRGTRPRRGGRLVRRSRLVSPCFPAGVSGRDRGSRLLRTSSASAPARSTCSHAADSSASRRVRSQKALRQRSSAPARSTSTRTPGEGSTPSSRGSPTRATSA